VVTMRFSYSLFQFSTIIVADAGDMFAVTFFAASL